MAYLIFHQGNDYDQGSLARHLSYLKNWGGTPDCWDSAEDLGKAIDCARAYGRPVSVVDEDTWSVVYIYPQGNM
jgi:hypothetical protein